MIEEQLEAVEAEVRSAIAAQDFERLESLGSEANQLGLVVHELNQRIVAVSDLALTMLRANQVCAQLGFDLTLRQRQVMPKVTTCVACSMGYPFADPPLNRWHKSLFDRESDEHGDGSGFSMTRTEPCQIAHQIEPMPGPQPIPPSSGTEPPTTE